jgi:hypothetical protein
MDQLDVYIAEHAQHPVAFLTNPQHSEIELIDLSKDVTAAVEALKGHGLEYVATAGIVSGEPTLAFARPLPEPTAFAIGLAFRCHVEQRRSGEPVYCWLTQRYTH